MAKRLLSDELWTLIDPLIQPDPPHPKVGRKRVERRFCFTSFLFVLKTDMPWEYLPRELAAC